MARPKRIQIPWLIHHVVSRGNGKMTIFLDDTDYRWFSYLLGDVLERFGVECWHYCLMPNHYHATLRPTAANLSEAVRHLNSRYAQWWNKRYKRVGHVFQGRFKDQVVQEEGYLLTLGRYIARNPVKAKLAANPEDWEWSSYSATAGLRPPPSFLFPEAVLNQYRQRRASRTPVTLRSPRMRR